MTIDEAIKKLLDEAKQQDKWADNYVRMDYYSEATPPEVRRQHAKECRQLAEWLTELKELQEENKALTRDCLRLIKSNDKLRKRLKWMAEYKRLLKVAVEDMSEKNFCAKVCKRDSFACRVSDTCDFKWRYADEAKKLLNDEK